MAEVAEKALPADLPDDQTAEYELAHKEKRQPRCIDCGQPLDKILQTQYTDLTWTWNSETMSYDKHDGGDAEKPSCGNCGGKNWDLCDEDVYTFF